MMGLLTAVLLAATGDGAANATQLRTTWRTEAGTQVALEDLTKEPVVLAFVYTSCTATCPLTTAKLKKLEDALLSEGRRARIVVVSLDPEHDTPEAVVAYRQQHGLLGRDSWMVLVGPEASLRTLTMLLDFRYSKNPESKVITHDNKVFVLGRGGAVTAQSSSLDDVLRPLLDAVPMSTAIAPDGGQPRRSSKERPAH